MTTALIQDTPRSYAAAIPLPPAAPPSAALAAQPASRHVPPGGTERRRPGRRDDVSPELIALMRKPTTAARVRVAMYDAPNFILQTPGIRAPRRQSVLQMAAACVICSALSAGAVQGMLMLWG